MSEWLAIINPSDEAHILGDDLMAAQVATLLLGHGKYSLQDSCGSEALPLFLFGGFEEWWEGLDTGESLDDWLGAHGLRVAAALRTVTYGSSAECESQAVALRLIDDPAKRDEFIMANEDRRRSSMNAIVQAARSIAERIEKKCEVAG